MAAVTTRSERTRKGAQAKPPNSATSNDMPSEDEVRLLAYRLYERRCEAGLAGDAEADWVQAERLLANSVPVDAQDN